jgi:endonuclease YncB( thermonuclease family)
MNLEDVTKDVQEFTLMGKVLQGKVVEMYDADTCKIVMCIHNLFYKFTCRLSGIDTPEIKPLLSKPNRENEIEWAKKARANLLSMICCDAKYNNNINITKEEIIHILQANRNLVSVKCLEADKYGRILVELYGSDKEKSFNNLLVERGLAVQYDGGKKINPWTQ